jgi:hypothetical protein
MLPRPITSLSVCIFALVGAFACTKDPPRQSPDCGDSACDSVASPAAATSPPNGDGGAGSTQLADGQSPQCLAQDDGHVYWLNDDATLAAVDKHGGQVIISHWQPPSQPAISTTLARTCAIVVDNGWLYATMPALGKLARVSTQTNGGWDLGGEGALFGDLSIPSSLALDDDAFYVTEADTGLLKKLHRTGAALDAGSDAGAELIFSQRTGDRPGQVVLGAGVVFWFDDAGLRAMSRDGGTIQTLVPERGFHLVAAAGALTWWPEAAKSYLAPMTIPFAGGGVALVPWAPVSDYEEAVSRGDQTAEQSALLALDAICDPNAETVTGADADFGAGFGIAGDESELFFATGTRFHRRDLPSGTVSDAFSYSACGESPGQIATHVIIDHAQVFWSNETTIWRHPRN